ncbi:MAG: hypothetical protein A2079_02095 [Geobacteraceae bacterium GWC2_48_7]|nr:MAG: hypothetical protein A2079_02095 [Geobacteraceae bacterium GWC2_48_7]
MAIVNHAKREINAKIVYFGPEGAGKATAIRYAYDRIKPSLRGELKSVSASGSDLLFFHFKPFEQTLSGGYSLYLNIYTLHGKVTHPAAWKMTLKGADGVVIMGDVSPGMLTATKLGILQLRDILSGYGVALDDLPCVLQMNKADLCESPATGQIGQLAVSLGVGEITSSFSNGKTGQGVLEALTILSRQVIERISSRDDLKTLHGFAVESGDKANALNPRDAGEVDVVNESEMMETDLLEIVTETPDGSTSSSFSAYDPQTTDIIRIAVAGEEVRCEEGVVKIPLEIVTGHGSRKVVVTVSAELQ